MSGQAGEGDSKKVRHDRWIETVQLDRSSAVDDLVTISVSRVVLYAAL